MKKLIAGIDIGGVAEVGDFLFKTLREMIEKQVKILNAAGVKILPAGLAADNGNYGALALARFGF